MAIVLTGCCALQPDLDEQALRHAVFADLIERHHVPEGHLRVESVRVYGPNAEVSAGILVEEGRAGLWKNVRYRAMRTEGGVWAVAPVGP